MERDGHLSAAADGRDRRSRMIRMTESGRKLWINQATPKIHAYDAQVLENFSTDDVTHTLHYLLKLLDNMKQLDDASRESGGDEEG
jgi:DNA-binding MarR family transcriptional regulator